MKRLLLVMLVGIALLSALASAEGNAQGGTDDAFDRDLLAFIRAQNERENYIVSPLSFRAALALAAEGAAASTREQLLGAMGFASEEELRAWYDQVMESVRSFDAWVEEQYDPEASAYAYRVLNSVWNNADTYGEFLPEYVAAIAERYGATAERVPADQLTDAVNAWCDAATDGLIPKISDDLSDCAAALVNAVYLKSAWVDTFEAERTEPEDFTDIDGKVTPRDMMKATGSYLYYEGEGSKLVSVPLNGDLAFVAVLGDDSNWLQELDAAEYAQVDLWLPKLDTQSSFGKEVLVRYLQERGAVDAFEPNDADFSRMADYPWYIGDILQKAKIKTDENGLEAAAVTMVTMCVLGLPPEPEEPPREFHATEPFRYYIVTTGTQTPLVVFAGQEVR